MRQPCPRCKQLINVYPDNHLLDDVLRGLGLALEQAKVELLDLQMATAENFKVSSRALKISQIRVRCLKEELKRQDQRSTSHEEN